MRQDQLGDAVGVSQAEISRLEAGQGAHTSIETWVAIGIALDRPLAIGFSRDLARPLADAGHLAAQELMTRIAMAGGWRASFEAAVDGSSFAGSTDVLLERENRVVLCEIWNRLDDLGAAARSSDRKVARVTAAHPEKTVGCLWLFVDTAANEAIVRAFPGILRTRFPASSSAWVKAFWGGTPPSEPGIAWIDLRGGRIRAMRRHPGRAD